MQLHRYWIALFRVTTVVAVLSICYLAFTPQAFKIHFSHVDKVYHVITFFVLFFLLDFSFPVSGINWQKVLTLAGFAVVIEVVQSHLPYRDFSIYDMGADFAGMIVYLLALPILKKLPILNLRWQA